MLPFHSEIIKTKLDVLKIWPRKIDLPQNMPATGEDAPINGTGIFSKGFGREALDQIIYKQWLRLV